MISFKNFEDLKHNSNMMDVAKILTNTVKTQSEQLEKEKEKNSELAKKSEELEILVQEYARKKSSVIECLGYITVHKSLPEIVVDKINYLLAYLKDEIENVSGLASFENDFDISMVDGIDHEESFMQPNTLDFEPLEVEEKIENFDSEEVNELKNEVQEIKKNLKKYLKKFEEFEDMERFENMKQNRIKIKGGTSESNYSTSGYESGSKYSSKRSSSHMKNSDSDGKSNIKSNVVSDRSSSMKKKASFLKRSVHNSSSLAWILQSNAIFSQMEKYKKSPKKKKG